MGLVLVVLLTALGAWLLREEPAGECAVPVEAGRAEPRLVKRSDLLPAGSEGDRRRAVVDAVEGLGGPVGSVVTGRFFEKLTERPSVLAYADRLALVTAPPSGGAALDVVDPVTAGTDWRVELGAASAWSTFTGGPVGDDLVLAFSGAEPTLLTLAEDSAPLVCQALPRASGGGAAQVRTDQAGEDVVLATVSDAGERRLQRLDPTSGEVRWTRSGTGGLVSLAVAGDRVLLASADATSVATEGLPAGGVADPLAALSLDDGSPAWSSAGDEAFVFLAADGDGTAYSLAVGAEGTRLVALDSDGQERWSRPAPEGFTSAWVWDDRLVLRGPDPAGGPMLRAVDTSTGRPAWQVRARQVPAVGDGPRSGFATPLVEDGTAWVPAPNGLVEVDVESGRATRHDSAARVDQLLRVGGSTVVVSGAALLVTR